MHTKSTLSLLLVASLVLASCKKEDPPPPPPAFTFESVEGFVISDEGEKLLATSAGLCSLNVKLGSYVALETTLTNTPLQDLAYSFQHPERELWLASDMGAYNYTGDYQFTTANSGLADDRVSNIAFNLENIAFFSTPEGLSLQHKENWSAYTGMANFFLDHEITDIGSASNGYTYVCTYGGGIERFKAEADGISGATIMDTDWTQLESNEINSVYIDDTTQVYGTNMGVGFHFSEYTKWDWEVYTSADGLVNDTVLSVVRDLSGKWWIGTAKGISLFDESSWVSYSSEEYELTGDYVRFLAVDRDGSIWMASNQGLSHFKDESWTAYPKHAQ